MPNNKDQWLQIFRRDNNGSDKLKFISPDEELITAIRVIQYNNPELLDRMNIEIFSADTVNEPIEPLDNESSTAA